MARPLTPPNGYSIKRSGRPKYSEPEVVKLKHSKYTFKIRNSKELSVLFGNKPFSRIKEIVSILSQNK